MTMKERIAAKLTRGLVPTTLDIVDKSDRHKGHAGAGAAGETPAPFYIVAQAFVGKGRLERHRMVNALLADEFGGRRPRARAENAGATGKS